MSLVLIIEDGTGVPGANSYVTTGEADAYLSFHAQRSAWAAKSADDKAAALVQAARMLNGANWKGSKIDIGQSLAWPRYGVMDENAVTAWDPLGSRQSTVYPDDQVPQPVKDAQCELAILQATTGDRTADKDSDGIRSVKVGKGALEVEFDASTRPTTFGNAVNGLLAGAGLVASNGRCGPLPVVRV